MPKHMRVPKTCNECPFLDHVDSTVYEDWWGRNYCYWFHCELYKSAVRLDRKDARIYHCPLCVHNANVISVHSEKDGWRFLQDNPPETCGECPAAMLGDGDGLRTGKCKLTDLVTAYSDFRPRRCPLVWEEP